MVFMTVLVISSTTYIVHAFNKAALGVDRDVKTRLALERARDALIAYAAKPDKDSPGHLPCPDRTEDPDSEAYGKAESTCGTLKTRVGRLPWKTLGIEELKDGYGEPLWYAVSRCFLKRNGDEYCGQYLINSNTQGQLYVEGTDASDAVAIIFSAGAPLPGQNRTPRTSQFVDVANYLEGENADGGELPIEEKVEPIADSRDYFEIRPRCEWDSCGAYFNDQLLAVRPEEYFPVLEAYVQSRVEREIRPLLEQHYAYWGTYPYAAPLDGRETRREDKSSPPLPLPALIGERETYSGLLPLNLQSRASDMEGWNAACSPSSADSKHNVKTRNRSASLQDGSCRVSMDICRNTSSDDASIEIELHTRLDGGKGWIDRGFFGAPMVLQTSTLLAPEESTELEKGTVAATGQGRARLRIHNPRGQSWVRCDTDDDDEEDDEEDDESSSWSKLEIKVAPPRLIEALNNPIGPLEWFFKNEWYRVIGYQRAKADIPANEYLSILGAAEQHARASLIMAGAPMTSAARAIRRADPASWQCPSAPTGHPRTEVYLRAFFEEENVHGCPPLLPRYQTLAATSVETHFNDRVIPLNAVPLMP